MLLTVHAASRAPGRLAQGSEATFFASLAFNAAPSSNMAAFSLTRMDENLEWNIWPHATRHAAAFPRAETPLPRRDIWSLVPTNS